MLSRLPGGILSGVTLMTILWLTLSPRPFGENPPGLFPGADKLAHAIMFGGFCAMMMLDWQRKHAWRKEEIGRILFFALLSTLSGIMIEYVQAYMNLGRGFEYQDMAADGAGALAAAVFWIIFQNRWIVNPSVRPQKRDSSNS